LEEAAQSALKCLNFKLQFDSTIVANVKVEHPKAKLNLSITYAVSATIPLRYQGGAIVGNDTTQVTSLSVTGVPKPCKAIPNSADVPFFAELDLASDFDLTKASGPAGIILRYGPGFPTTTVTILCEDEEPVPLPLSWGYYYYGIFHKDEIRGFSLLEARGWKPTGGKSPWATRSYGQVQVIQDGTISEITFLRIDHTPQ
jgi:hypothetical protein